MGGRLKQLRRLPADSAAADDLPLRPRRRGVVPARLRQFGRSRSALASAIFLLLLVAVAVTAAWIAPYDPEFRDSEAVLAGSSSAHWLGTDDSGRDILSRLVHATQISMVVSVSVVALALLIALPLGLIAGYHGGHVDNVIMRLTDGALSFPAIVLALAIAGVLGAGVRNTILALAIVIAPGLVRLIRGQALAVRQETYIEASLSIGTSAGRIMLTRMLPNVRSVVIVQSSYLMGAALLAEASLSFLGLGAPPPTPTWGNMLRRSYDTALFTEPVQLVASALVIVATVYAFNTVGDGLRDTLGVARARPPRRQGARRGLTAVDRQGTGQADAAIDDGSALLRMSNLSVDFYSSDGTSSRVVNDVSLEIRRGEVVGLVGESGSGKSVTSLSIMRLVPPSAARIVEGSIELDGRDLLGLSFEQMRRVRGKDIGMIFQDPMSSLDPAFTVGDQLVEAQAIHGVGRKAARRRAVEMIELVGIPGARERMSAYPHQLSGGMRQRVMIALALVNRPALLIADEPTTALDVTVQAEILDLLRNLRRELGMAILFITHDLGVVADLSDRVAVMYAGEIVEERPVFDLFAAPAHPYTEGLLGAMPQLERRRSRLLTVIPGNVPVAANMPSGCRFHPRCSHVLDACADKQVELRPTAEGRVRCLRAGELSLKGTE